MSVRNKSYNDYGLTETQAAELIKYCRSGSFNQHDLLRECALSSNIELVDFLTETITKKLSYEKLCSRYYVPIDKNSFYGYRRKCVALLYWKIYGRNC